MSEWWSRSVCGIAGRTPSASRDWRPGHDLIAQFAPEGPPEEGHVARRNAEAAHFMVPHQIRPSSSRSSVGLAEDRHVRLPRAIRIDKPRSHDAASEALLKRKPRRQSLHAISECLEIISGVIGG
jgi:hypothetical protein